MVLVLFFLVVLPVTHHFLVYPNLVKTNSNLPIRGSCLGDGEGHVELEELLHISWG